MPEKFGSASSPVDAKGSIKVTSKKLEAKIMLQSPQNGGTELTLQQLRNLLIENNIKAGILEEELVSLAEKPVYDQPFIIAIGEKPEDGKDAELIYTFNPKRDIRPKERPDGSVDFKDLGIIESVEKGDLLCTKKSATEGTPGLNIYGDQIPAKPGKECSIPAGKNTVLSEDRVTLHAAIHGQVEIVDGRICVFDTYTINGDVSPATGDIRFAGNILITGGVLSGFSVQASGDIDIAGVVESAQVITGGSLIIRGGFSGGETGILESGIDITCRFIQGGKVTLKGDLETTYILNSDISCGGSVNLIGKGLIVGGQVCALDTVAANIIGNANATPTVIEVGNAPGLLKRTYVIPDEIESCEKSIQTSEKYAKSLLQLKNIGHLKPEYAEQLKKALQHINEMRTRKNELELELQAANQQLEIADKGQVKVRKTAHIGVKIIIGNVQYPLKSRYDFTCFTRCGGIISCLPYS